MAPLGVFVWFGIPTEILLFEGGYWPFSVLLLFVYYVGNFWLLAHLLKVDSKWVVGVAIFVIWLVGFFGFLQVVNEVSVRFS
ncbi:MAG: hypothetical protein KDD60_07345 [Bdellovibrionales bacterium]|nr:hypothetical protein [Bdellovibrionales bacterium]